TRQVPNTINATIAVADLPNAYRLISVPLTMLRSFRMRHASKKCDRHLGLGSGSSWSICDFINDETQHRSRRGFSSRPRKHSFDILFSSLSIAWVCKAAKGPYISRVGGIPG